MSGGCRQTWPRGTRPRLTWTRAYGPRSCASAEDDVREVRAAAGRVVRVGDVDPESEAVLAVDRDLDLHRRPVDEAPGCELLPVAGDHGERRRLAGRRGVVEPDGGAERLVLPLEQVVDPGAAAPLVVAARVERDRMLVADAARRDRRRRQVARDGRDVGELLDARHVLPVEHPDGDARGRADILRPPRRHDAVRGEARPARRGDERECAVGAHRLVAGDAEASILTALAPVPAPALVADSSTATANSATGRQRTDHAYGALERASSPAGRSRARSSPARPCPCARRSSRRGARPPSRHQAPRAPA
jgi:hypothetical protein